MRVERLGRAREHSHHVEETAVTVEVDDLVGPPLGLGAAERRGQCFEGGRAEQIEVEGLAGLLGEALEDSGGDRAEGGVGAPVRPADDEEDTQRRASLELRQRRLLGRIGQGADEGAGAQRDRNLALGVSQQLPNGKETLAICRARPSPSSETSTLWRSSPAAVWVRRRVGILFIETRVLAEVYLAG